MTVQVSLYQLQFLVKALNEEILISDGEYAKSLIWLKDNLSTLDKPMSAYKKRKQRLKLKLDPLFLGAMYPHCGPRIKHVLKHEQLH